MTTMYFAIWIGIFMVIKTLLLAEYGIEFYGLTKALVGALVLAKVVLVMEHFSLGTWVRTQPAWVDVVLRTALYSLGVLVVLLLEKAFEGRHENGGFVPALMSVLRHANVHHVWVNVIVISGALLAYNAFGVLKRKLGEDELGKLFMSPLR